MKSRIILTFSASLVNEPVTFNLIKQFDLQVNILKANISSGETGTLLLELNGDEDQMKLAKKYLTQTGVEVQAVEKAVYFQKEACIHCGACTAVCFAGALQLKTLERKLVFKPEKCVVCGLCTKACPLQLFKMAWGYEAN